MNLSWEKLSGMKKAYVFLLNSFILSQMVLVDINNLAKRSFSCLLGTLVALESARSMGDSSHLFVNPQEFGVRLLWFLGTVEIGNFT